MSKVSIWSTVLFLRLQIATSSYITLTDDASPTASADPHIRLIPFCTACIQQK
ncbi:MAG: hypothetical protein ABII90_06325 [Bacteroidota bacterium]